MRTSGPTDEPHERRTARRGGAEVRLLVLLPFTVAFGVALAAGGEWFQRRSGASDLLVETLVTIVLVVWAAVVVATTLRHLDREAADRRRLTAAVVEASADAIVSVDAEGRFTGWNPGAQALLGYRSEEVLGRPVTLLVPEDLRAELGAGLARVRAGESVVGWRTTRRAKSGQLIDVEMTVSPLPAGRRGQYRGATATMRDLRASEEAGRRFATVLEAAPDGMLVVDSAGTVEQVNARIEEMFGWTRGELVGRPVEVLVPAARRTAHVRLREEWAAAGPHGHVMNDDLALSGLTKDGREVPVEITLRPLHGTDGLHVIAAVRDVSERREAERRLAASEERFRRSFEDSDIGMALVSTDAEAPGRVLEVNDALCRLTGFAAGAFRDMGVSAPIHPDDVPGIAHGFAELCDGRRPVLREEMRLVAADGSVVWVSTSVSVVREPDGTPLHAVVQIQDITERRRVAEQLQHLADHDALTGLFNRRRFEEELVRELAFSRRYRTGGAVMVLDLDHFKLVNDTLGHAAGDDLIAITAGILRARLRESDILGRMGGDEFAVLLPREDGATAAAIAESLLQEIHRNAPAIGVGGGPRVTASIGIAPFGPGDETASAEDLLARADIAMYDAKEAGRDRVAVYDSAEGRHARMQARVAWAGRIAVALEEDRFELHAQPIIDLGGHDAAASYELLLRMRSEDDGELILPPAFLPVAERSDLAKQIDRWVVRRAVEMLAAEREHGRDVRFSVNLSGTSLDDHRLLDDLVETIADSGVDPRALTFEVTETAAIGNVARATEFARRLRDAGCRFALDDFGTGFASFYYLKHMAFDDLKIDGEFIRELPSSPTNQLVVQAVVAIARGLGKRTIAECVGDDETVALLRSYGVDAAQGFFLGRPEPLARALARAAG